MPQRHRDARQRPSAGAGVHSRPQLPRRRELPVHDVDGRREVAAAGWPWPPVDQRGVLLDADVLRPSSSGCGSGSPTAGPPARAGRPPGRSAACASRAAPGRATARPTAAPACTGAPAARRSSAFVPISMMRPRYITRDPVGDVPHDRQVVGDEQVGQAELLLEVLQQVDHLRLDRHVERRDRLVADDDLRAQRERAGDPDALALAAGELVRVPVHGVGVEPDPFEQLAHRPRRARSAARPRGGSRTASPTMSPDGHPRVQRRVRVLEDDLDLAPQPAQLLPGIAKMSSPSVEDLAGGRLVQRAASTLAPRSTCRSPTRRPARPSRRGHSSRSTPSTARTWPTTLRPHARSGSGSA